MKTDDRTNEFQHLVLFGIWIIILLLAGGKPWRQTTTWRSNACAFGDLYGVQTDEAKEYRRNITYPPTKL